MSAIKRYLEDLIYTMTYDELHSLLKSEGWTDEEIKELYDAYHGTKGGDLVETLGLFSFIFADK